MKKGVTAAELLAQLKADPEYVARQAHRDEAERLERARLRAAEEPLVTDLNRAGLNVTSVWDLVNALSTYPVALPVLVEHLQRKYPPQIREGIARAMAEPAAKAARRQLIEGFLAEDNARVKDGLALAIAATTDDGNVHDVIDLVRNVRLGSSRVLLLQGLSRSRTVEAREALKDARNDAELKHEARALIAKSRRQR